MTLQEAVQEYIQQARNFEQWYLEQHQQDPENFPLELPDDNAGAWFEQIQDHSE